ncbi:MAG: hypothetical protein EKK55_21455 [Rhodocyclaceae bacterium]|nr:MAG: hypothetical protein EKK55_21455 [Rhodocyclaceae bacterium]
MSPRAAATAGTVDPGASACVGRPSGLAVGACGPEPLYRCARCGEPLPEPPPPATSDWGDWQCTRCGAAHCQDGEPDDVCAAPLTDDDECPRYAADRAATGSS